MRFGQTINTIQMLKENVLITNQDKYCLKFLIKMFELAVGHLSMTVKTHKRTFIQSTRVGAFYDHSHPKANINLQHVS